MKQKKLHIAMLVDAWFPTKARPDGIIGGGQVHVKELSSALEKNFNCTIDLYFPPQIAIHKRALWTLTGIVRLIKNHQNRPYDIIHAHGFACALTGKIASVMTKTPIVHTVHGSHMMDQAKIHPKTWLENILLTKIPYNKQITVSGNFLKYQNINNPLVIPNGVNVKDFDKISVKKYKDPTLIWVGRNDPVKGLTYLKKAIQNVRKKIPNLRSNLITDGKISGPELYKEYKKSHLFVLSSLAEGQPITLLEAWAAKLPVVVTDVGDNKEMIENEKNGYLIEPGNVKQLSQAILKIVRAKVTNKRMGEAGYNLVCEKYSWGNIATRVHNVYLDAIKSGKK